MTEEVRWKMIFGFALLAGLLGIGMVVALGKVEQQTSFGLQEIITTLVLLSGGFAHWAFGGDKPKSGGRR